MTKASQKFKEKIKRKKNLTHNQDPWINAYVNGQRNEITKEDIKRYFDD